MVIRCDKNLLLVYAELLCFACFLLPTRSNSWNLTALRLPEDALLWKFAVWRNRAFLAVPRWTDDWERSFGESTLFEAPWPEFNTNSPAHAFVQKSRATEDCLRSVTGLEVDHRGRLWILETPENCDCWARVVVYNLKRNRQLVSSIELTEVPTKNLRALVVDQTVSRAYIGDPGEESIVVFSLEKRSWWRIRMIRSVQLPRVYSTEMAISRKNSVLYVTGHETLDLFSINLEDLRDDGHISKHGRTENITVFWHGTKMGFSSGLFCDVKGGLHYFMTTEKASVRWDTRLPLKAESHEILLQNEDYPCITDYRMDQQKNLWGLVNTYCPFSKKIGTRRTSLKYRTVKVGKYTCTLTNN